MFNPLEKGDEELTIKQRLFCKAYLENGYNATQAAITAGYSEHTARSIATENMAKPAIKQYIDKVMQETEKKLDITREWKMKMLKETAEASFNGQTSEKGLVNPNGVVSCIAELNKMQGHYAKPENTSAEKVITDIKDTINEFEREY